MIKNLHALLFLLAMCFSFSAHAQSTTVKQQAFYDLNTTNFASGLYFVSIQTEEGVQTERLVVER